MGEVWYSSTCSWPRPWRWVGPRADMDHVEKPNVSSLPGLELDPAAVERVAGCYIDCTIPATLYLV